MTRAAAADSGQAHVIPPLEMPRDEMAFRRQYEPMLLARTLTTVFRPGNRLWPNWRGYQPGEIVTARVIDKPGSDARGIAPQFTAARIPIEIVDIKVIRAAALAAADFCGSSPDVHDAESLRVHLAEIYEQSLSAFDDVVTRIKFAYLDPA
ncbi:MAG: hypothetical protein B7Y49_13860 [Sphingomonas sp. 28-62-11]|nr:MAG: hypothetical protein B7Y49_13860 [Sphingomonas sp. 28-62-11]